MHAALLADHTAAVILQDKINAFWEITKKDLDDRKAELRNKDREMEEMEERHQVEIKARGHLLCWHGTLPCRALPCVHERSIGGRTHSGKDYYTYHWERQLGPITFDFIGASAVALFFSPALLLP